MRRGPGRRARGLNCRRRAERAGGLPFVTLRQVRACMQEAGCLWCMCREGGSCRPGARRAPVPTGGQGIFLSNDSPVPCWAAALSLLCSWQFDDASV